MKIRTVESSIDDRLIVDSFAYGNINEIMAQNSVPDNCFSLYYITQGNCVIKGMLISAYAHSAPNFSGKTTSSAVFDGSVVTLPNKIMTLVFFTAPSTGIYRLRIDCQAIEFPENCNIWYFKGDDESGYRFLEIDGEKNRHDPQKDRGLFQLVVTLAKGQSLVIGIGNYYGTKLQINEFTITSTKSTNAENTGRTFDLFSGDPAFAVYDHTHSAASSHLEKTGGGFLLRPNEKVALTSNEAASVRMFRIIFHGEDAERYYRLVDPGLHGIFSHGFTKNLAEIISLLFASDSPVSRGIAALVFDDILSLHENKQKMKVNLYVEDAKERVLRNLKKPIRVTDIAAELGVSDRYLYNLFVKFEGVSPKQFINNARITRAKKLLVDRDMTVTEVAEAVGFTDALNFSHFFTGQVGISPSKYKKEQKGK